MNEKKFSEYTELILSKLPSWFAIKTSSKSVGADFLNIIGLSLEEMHETLEYAYRQTKLETIDASVTSAIYKALLPIHHEAEKISQVKVKDQELRIVYTLEAFNGEEVLPNPYGQLYDHNVCLIDVERCLIYVKKDTQTIDYKINDTWYTSELSLHHIWTFLDEFGMLFDCKRHYGETNEHYLYRLKDLFKHQRGSHKVGLMNGIASELGLRHYVMWDDPSEPLILPHPMVVVNSIYRGDFPVAESEICLTFDGALMLKPLGSYCTEPQVVSYISGLEMHQLHQKEDKKLPLELVKIDNTATDLLYYYKERIHADAPITWDHFKWGEGMWNTSEHSITGQGVIPHIWDGNISGFKHFKPNE